MCNQKTKNSKLTCHSRHYAANIICYSEKVSYCGGIQKLVLFQGRKKEPVCDGEYCATYFYFQMNTLDVHLLN